MSAPDSPIVLSVMTNGRHFQVLVMRDAPSGWFGTISERTGGLMHTQPLGSVETQDGPDVALHGALDHILQVAGITPTARQAARAT
jgi:hypothetical protein